MVVLSVKGMMCERCEDCVKQIIQRIAGVVTVKVDTNEETAVVNGKFDLNQLFNALEGKLQLIIFV